jgi:hypothetical protein
LFIVTVIIFVRRKAEGRKWNLCLLTLLFVGNMLYQVLMTINILTFMSILKIEVVTGTVLYVSRMGILCICQ